MAKKVDEKMLERETSVFIRKLGIYPHLSGYKAIVEGVKLSIEDPSYLKNITTRLYPAIAVKVNSSGTKVERAIRHSIVIAANANNIEMANLFQGASSAPTNSMFLATVAEEMKFMLGIE